MHAMHAIVLLTMRMAADGSPRTLWTAATVVRTWVGYMAGCKGIGDNLYAAVGAILHAYNTAYIHADDAHGGEVGVWCRGSRGDDGGMGGCMTVCVVVLGRVDVCM